MTSTESAPAPSLAASLGRGAYGFTLLSVAGFSVWAFGGRWFSARIGEGGMYVVSALVFLGLSGLLLHPLMAGERRVRRFYGAFLPAFLLYAVIWSGCWFGLGSGWGEWLGSFAGCAALAALLARSFGNFRTLPWVILVLFILHSAGYFAGGEAMAWLKPGAVSWLDRVPRRNLAILAKLSWGVCYGFGFGLGLGYAFHRLQRR